MMEPLCLPLQGFCFLLFWTLLESTRGCLCGALRLPSPCSCAPSSGDVSTDPAGRAVHTLQSELLLTLPVPLSAACQPQGRVPAG